MRNRFSTAVKEVISYSAEEAGRTGSEAIGAAHLLLGLFRRSQDETVLACKAVVGQRFPDLLHAIEATLPVGPYGSSHPGRFPLDRGAERVIRRSVAVKRPVQDREVGTKQLLLSLLQEGDEDLVAVLRRFGINEEGV